jgi:MoxR-like ATPase
MSNTQEIEINQESVEYCRQCYEAITTECAKVIVGQESVVREVLIAIFTKNHALLVGVPGLAKTLLISTLAQALQLSFKRIQFTPDLMPSDISGTEVISQNPETGEKAFRFIAGPLFANIVLADEINRTPPKTQAAMLEAMQERRVTVGGVTHGLPDPFFVLATQNPLEQEGTYPLPEAQLDRFLFLIRVGYPSAGDEIEIMKRARTVGGEKPRPVLDAESILHIQKIVRAVAVADHVYDYVRAIVRATRPEGEEALPYCRDNLTFGAGPRASLGLISAACANAILDGRAYAACEDVAAVAPGVLRHRIACNFVAQSAGITPDAVVEHVLGRIPAQQVLA